MEEEKTFKAYVFTTSAYRFPVDMFHLRCIVSFFMLTFALLSATISMTYINPQMFRVTILTKNNNSKMTNDPRSVPRVKITT